MLKPVIIYLSTYFANRYVVVGNLMFNIVTFNPLPESEEKKNAKKLEMIGILNRRYYGKGNSKNVNIYWTTLLKTCSSRVMYHVFEASSSVNDLH